jgi:hypothetical protein
MVLRSMGPRLCRGATTTSLWPSTIKWIVANAITTTKVVEIINEIINLYGVMNTIITDNDT